MLFIVRLADHSSTGVLLPVVHLTVIVKPRQKGNSGPTTDCRTVKETYTLKYRRTSEAGIDRNVDCNVEAYFVANVDICFSRLRQAKAPKISG